MKKFVSLLLAATLALGLVACGGNNNGDSAKDDSKKLVVGATPSPHAELLEEVKPILKEQGIELEIVEFTDYVLPNKSVDEGSTDANFFQHQPYLTDFNAEQGTDLVSAGNIHFEPLGVYPGKSDDIKNVPDGAKIAVPNDATNEARALQLLEAQGIIKLAEDAGLKATPNDIVENPHNVEIVELEAAQVPLRVEDVDFAVINGNYALTRDGLIDTVLVTEDPESDAALEYANIIAVLPKNKDDERVKALVEALQSESIKEFIKEKYGVTVLPVA